LKRRYLDSAIKRLKFWSGNREGKRLAEQFAEHSKCNMQGNQVGSRFVAGGPQGDNNKCPFVIVIALLAASVLMYISVSQILSVSNVIAVVLSLGIAAAVWFVRSSLPDHAGPLTLPTAQSGCDTAQQSPQERLQRTVVAFSRVSPIQLPNVVTTQNQRVKAPTAAPTVFHASATPVTKASMMDNNAASAPEFNAEDLTVAELRWLLKEGNQNPFGPKEKLVERLTNPQPKRKMPTSGNTNSRNKRKKTTQSTTKRKR